MASRMLNGRLRRGLAGSVGLVDVKTDAAEDDDRDAEPLPEVEFHSVSATREFMQPGAARQGVQ